MLGEYGVIFCSEGNYGVQERACGIMIAADMSLNEALEMMAMLNECE